ncbi:MAG: hypothetical protein V3V01_18115 [Acidimicrobiales bacterium]
MQLFAEGLWAVRLPCTLALFVPGLIPLLTSRRNAPVAVTAYLLAASIVFWLRATGDWFDSPEGVVAVLVGLAVIAAAIATWRIENKRSAAIGGTVVGTASAWLWIPCVGRNLGNLLNDATSQGSLALLPRFGIYVGSVCALLIVIALIPFAWPKITTVRDHDRTQFVGLAIGGLLGLAIAVGLYDNIVAELARISLRIQ